MDAPIYEEANDGVENLEYYQSGGLHPVYLGDRFENDRYTVLQKLGHGSSSTVWLAEDQMTRQYVAIKILTAIDSQNPREIIIQETVSRKLLSSVQQPVAKILDSFTIDGPNGHHECIVLELVGPSLQDLLPGLKIRPDHIRKIASHIASAVAAVHGQDVAVGDLSMDNILLRLKDLSALSPQAVLEKLGQPQPWKVTILREEETYSKHSPNVVYPRIDYRHIDIGILSSILTTNVAITDLNEAVHVQEVEEEYELASAVNWPYASPERLFKINKRHSKKSDVWALACCFYQLRSKKPLFSGGSADDTASDIQLMIGPIPERWATSLDGREEDEDTCEIIPVDDLEESETTLEQKLRNVGDWSAWHTMTVDERRNWLSKDWGRDEVVTDDPVLESQSIFVHRPQRN